MVGPASEHAQGEWYVAGLDHVVSVSDPHELRSGIVIELSAMGPVDLGDGSGLALCNTDFRKRRPWNTWFFSGYVCPY